MTDIFRVGTTISRFTYMVFKPAITLVYLLKQLREIKMLTITDNENNYIFTVLHYCIWESYLYILNLSLVHIIAVFSFRNNIKPAKQY